MIPQAVLVVALAASPGVRRVGLTASGCPTSFVTEVRQLLAIELKATVGALLDSAPETVSLECAASVISVEVRRADAAPAPLTIDVSSVGDDSRARTVALVLAEVMSAPPTTVEVPKAPPPVVEPVTSVPAVENERPVLLTAGFTVRTLERVQLGGTVGVALTFLEWLGLHVDVSMVTAQVVRPGGRVQATSIDGAVGLDLRWSPGLVTLRLGPGFRFGWSALSGLPEAGRIGGQVSGVMWGPQVSLGATMRPAGWAFALNGGVDVGWWAPQLSGSVFGASPVVVAGPFGAFTLGVGWLP